MAEPPLLLFLRVPGSPWRGGGVSLLPTHSGGWPCPRRRQDSSRVPAAHAAGQERPTVWSPAVLNYNLILNLSFFPETPD